MVPHLPGVPRLHVNRPSVTVNRTFLSQEWIITDRTTRFVWNVFKPVVFKAFIRGFKIQSLQVYDEKHKLSHWLSRSRRTPQSLYIKWEGKSMYLYILSSWKLWTTALLYYTVASSNICYNVSKVELFNLSTILEVFESRNHVMLFDRAR